MIDYAHFHSVLFALNIAEVAVNNVVRTLTYLMCCLLVDEYCISQRYRISLLCLNSYRRKYIQL